MARRSESLDVWLPLDVMGGCLPEMTPVPRLLGVGVGAGMARIVSSVAEAFVHVSVRASNRN